MHVFITGGTGTTGPAVVAELISAGHDVTGLARTGDGAARLEALGATPVRGTIDDLDVLRDESARADGVVHMAFGGDFSEPSSLSDRDVAAIDALGAPLVDTGEPLVMTSGTLAMAAGSVSVEDDAPDPNAIGSLRIPGEDAARALAGRGVRTSVVRLAPTVHGPEDHGFVATLIATARRTGVSAYVGDGTNRWPAVHRLDAASLFRLALENAPAGQALHGSAETVVFRDLAEAIAGRLGVPAVSVTPDRAPDHFGNPFMAVVFGTDAPASSERTQTLLGWTPTHASLLDDLRDGDYFDRPELTPRH